MSKIKQLLEVVNKDYLVNYGQDLDNFSNQYIPKNVLSLSNILETKVIYKYNVLSNDMLEVFCIVDDTLVMSLDQITKLKSIKSFKNIIFNKDLNIIVFAFDIPRID